MRAEDSDFHELDDLILHLKGLVLVREVRQRAHADDRELEMYSAEIGQVRDRLADLVRNGSSPSERLAVR
jgi:hypothetical protein